MKIIILSFSVLSFCLSLFAQIPDTAWVKTLGGEDDDFGHFVQQTSDGGYIVAGYTKSFGAGLNDAWMVKTNANGDTIWSRTYGGIKDENCSCVRQTSDGGYILFVESDSFHHTYWQVWLVKTDKIGDTICTKVIGGDRHYFVESGLQISGVSMDYIFIGYTKVTGAGQEDLWLVKTDSHGDTIWTKTIGGPAGDLGHCIEGTNDGEFIISASTKSFGAGGYDCWLIKTDAHGDTLWSKVYGGTWDDHIYSIQQTGDHGYILAGATRSFDTVKHSYDVLLIKTDASGDTVWTKLYGSTEQESAYSVRQTADGGYIVLGYGALGTWILKTDAAGDTLWTKSMKTGSGMHIEQTADGGYIFVSTGFIGQRKYDTWLVKLIENPDAVGPYEAGISPTGFRLMQNYPNPFNPETTIEFILDKRQKITVKIFDALGREIKTLINREVRNEGINSIVWDGRDNYGKRVSSGIYYYRLTTSEGSIVRKSVLLK